MITRKMIDDLSFQIIGCAIEVHKFLGPGLLESVYEKCLRQELKLKGFSVSSQSNVPLKYKGMRLDCDLRYDILVENLVLVELKSVEFLHPVFRAQLLTYMKLLKIPKGILLNFYCSNIFKEGQYTFVNEYYSSLPD
ncbi:MAG: GxxExxY protein [Bacteroidales bacterium]|nr:GxxExxY protein [Bacteroidales bacterium]